MRCAVVADCLGERMELQLDIQRPESSIVGFRQTHRVEIECYRQVVANRDELLREEREVTLPKECFARPLLRDLRRVHEDVLDGAERVDQLLRRLVADAANARDVVGRIPDQGEVIGDECRRDAEALAAVLHADPLFLDARRAAAAGIQEPDAWTDELLKILVARHDNDVDLCLDSALRQRADHVIGFIAF
jgi:hypothetical protein